MTLEQMVRDKYVVAADDWMNMVVVWNGSVTFEVYSNTNGPEYSWQKAFRHRCANVFEAKRIAQKWIADQYNMMEAYFGEAA